jgi:hypothetical protein
VAHSRLWSVWLWSDNGIAGLYPEHPITRIKT